MRLLSFVPCGCRAGPIDDAPPAETLHAGDGAAARRRRRRARSLGVPQWRPSLGNIYEEYSTDAAKAGGGRRVVPARAGKSASWDVARVLPRAHSDEYRHLESASSMPAFVPTAYLF
ncbi:uncharacterized protein LOC133898351 [Phragmites australis]|uniref:uncharacterized protein LOC133898351 n=1 Tax=Phragmites australis TaxID=29695 RepID=UPI002D7A3B6F|nr:uncharacterized protein LOC133898351 [Phragmites australis]